MSSAVALIREASTDELLARRIQNFILSKNSSANSTFQVRVDGGIATLSGQVRSFYQKQLWIHGAKRVAGVIRVIDEIVVLQ